MDAALTFLFARDDVLQEVDRDGLVGGQVDLNLHREEVVAFPLALVLRLERLHVDRVHF